MERREKLIELIGDSLCCPKETDCTDCEYKKYELCTETMVADYLLANGVVVLKNESTPPCWNCSHGWGSASADGIKTCEESCLELREYEKRKGGGE